MGLTTKGTIGAETAVTLDDCCVKIREIIKAGREVNPDIMVICHGGPIADPEDAAYVAELVRKKMGVTNVMMNNLGPVIGGHTGAGMIAIVCMADHR